MGSCSCCSVRRRRCTTTCTDGPTVLRRIHQLCMEGRPAHANDDEVRRKERKPREKLLKKRQGQVYQVAAHRTLFFFMSSGAAFTQRHPQHPQHPLVQIPRCIFMYIFVERAQILTKTANSQRVREPQQKRQQNKTNDVTARRRRTRRTRRTSKSISVKETETESS